MYSYLKFVKHIIIVGTADLLGMAQGLIFLPVITKILGAEDYGIWAQLKITMCLLVPFTFLGLHEGLTRFLPGGKNKEEIQEGIYSSLLLIFAIALVLASLLMIFSNQAATFFRFDPIFIKFLSLIIIFESLNTILLVVVRATREIGKYFWFVVLKMFGETGLVIGAILLGYGLYGAVISLLIIRIVSCLFIFVYIFRKIGIKIPNFSLIKSYLSFGLPTIVNHVSYWGVTSMDRYLIGFFLGIIFVGYYAPAYSIGNILSLFIFPLALILSVVLPKFFDDNRIDEVKNYLSYSLKYFLLITIPAVFGLSILSRQLLVIFSTEEIADNSYLVVPFILVSILLYGIIYFFSQILCLVKKTKLTAIIWAMSALLNLVLNVIFIPRFGILAAAIATFASYFFAFILMWYFSFKELQFIIEWEFIAKSIGASFLMILLIEWFNPWGLLNVLLSIIMGIFIYTILIFLFKIVGKKEIIFLKNLIYEMAFPNK